MTTTPVSLGQFVATLKATRDQLLDREAFVARFQSKYDAPSIAGLPMVGLGGSCGKSAFLLPNVVRFDLEKVERLEAVAEAFGMFVEYGAYPTLKSRTARRWPPCRTGQTPRWYSCDPVTTAKKICSVRLPRLWQTLPQYFNCIWILSQKILLCKTSQGQFAEALMKVLPHSEQPCLFC